MASRCSSIAGATPHMYHVLMGVSLGILAVVVVSYVHMVKNRVHEGYFCGVHEHVV